MLFPSCWPRHSLFVRDQMNSRTVCFHDTCHAGRISSFQWRHLARSSRVEASVSRPSHICVIHTHRFSAPASLPPCLLACCCCCCCCTAVHPLLRATRSLAACRQSRASARTSSSLDCSLDSSLEPNISTFEWRL